MNGGTLIPNQDVARTPSVGIAVLGTGAKVEQFLNERFASAVAHSTHAIDMPSDIQCVALDDGVGPHGPPCLALMAIHLREVQKAFVYSDPRGQQRMKEDSFFSHLAEAVWHVVKGCTGGRQLCLATAGRYDKRGDDVGQRGRMQNVLSVCQAWLPRDLAR